MSGVVRKVVRPGLRFLPGELISAGHLGRVGQLNATFSDACCGGHSFVGARPETRKSSHVVPLRAQLEDVEVQFYLGVAHTACRAASEWQRRLASAETHIELTKVRPP